MKIFGYGDLIKDGEYFLHSSFDKVLNFSRGEKLISLVFREVGAGPMNIVADIIPKNLSKISVSKKSFKIGDKEFLKSKLKKYDSRFPSTLNAGFLKSLIDIMIILRGNAEAKSCAFLIDAKREKNFKGSFSRNFVSRIKSGVNDFLEGKFEQGTKKIRGTGFGLTPSGDDFLGGYLLGLTVAEKLSGKNFSRRKRIIYENALGKNLISNSFLFCRYSGKIDEKTGDFLSASVSDDRALILRKTLDLIKTGHTSGSDMLTGMILGVYGGMNEN